MAKYEVDVPKCIKKQITNPNARITNCKVIVLETVSTDNTVPEKSVSVYQITGDNNSQEFVDYYSMKGKHLGGLLKLKEEKFWQVWDENSQVVTETACVHCGEPQRNHVSHDYCAGQPLNDKDKFPEGYKPKRFEPMAGRWLTLGSTSKDEADNMLEQRIRNLLNL